MDVCMYTLCLTSKLSCVLPSGYAYILCSAANSISNANASISSYCIAKCCIAHRQFKGKRIGRRAQANQCFLNIKLKSLCENNN